MEPVTSRNASSSESGFHQRGVAIEDLAHLRTDLAVEPVISRQEHRMWAAPLGDGRRHRRVDTEPTGLVRRRGDDATIAGSTDDDGPSRQFGPPAQFDRDEECVHVNMTNSSSRH
jgi:hypothetical protein